MKRYRLWDPNQTVLFPSSLSDWWPQDHLAYFMLDLVADLDLSGLEDVIQGKDARGTRPCCSTAIAPKCAPRGASSELLTRALGSA
jgi:hypothetical protein